MKSLDGSGRRLENHHQHKVRSRIPSRHKQALVTSHTHEIDDTSHNESMKNVMRDGDGFYL